MKIDNLSFFISIFAIGILILILLGYRAYIKINLSKINRQPKVVEVGLLTKKLKFSTIDAYSTKSALKVVFIALVMIFVFVFSILILKHFFE